MIVQIIIVCLKENCVWRSDSYCKFLDKDYTQWKLSKLSIKTADGYENAHNGCRSYLILI